ncbi:MAG: hypothetical protein K2H39_03185, partial [Paramuribaculum sp.]|nr:hypothetical protein [Paramuribaculum sp.]
DVYQKQTMIYVSYDAEVSNILHRKKNFQFIRGAKLLKNAVSAKKPRDANHLAAPRGLFF